MSPIPLRSPKRREQTRFPARLLFSARFYRDFTKAGFFTLHPGARMKLS